MVDLANARGGADNITVAVIELCDGERGQDQSSVQTGEAVVKPELIVSDELDSELKKLVADRISTKAPDFRIKIRQSSVDGGEEQDSLELDAEQPSGSQTGSLLSESKADKETLSDTTDQILETLPEFEETLPSIEQPSSPRKGTVYDSIIFDDHPTMAEIEAVRRSYLENKSEQSLKKTSDATSALDNPQLKELPEEERSWKNGISNTALIICFFIGGLSVFFGYVWPSFEQSGNNTGSSSKELSNDSEVYFEFGRLKREVDLPLSQGIARKGEQSEITEMDAANVGLPRERIMPLLPPVASAKRSRKQGRNASENSVEDTLKRYRQVLKEIDELVRIKKSKGEGGKRSDILEVELKLIKAENHLQRTERQLLLWQARKEKLAKGYLRSIATEVTAVDRGLAAEFRELRRVERDYERMSAHNTGVAPLKALEKLRKDRDSMRSSFEKKVKESVTNKLSDLKDLHGELSSKRASLEADRRRIIARRRQEDFSESEKKILDSLTRERADLEKKVIRTKVIE